MLRKFCDNCEQEIPLDSGLELAFVTLDRTPWGKAKFYLCLSEDCQEIVIRRFGNERREWLKREANRPLGELGRMSIISAYRLDEGKRVGIYDEQNQQS